MIRAAKIVLLSMFLFVAHAAQFEVPPGFTIEKANNDGAVKFPMFATLDDRGRLFVAESSGLDLYEELQKQTRRCRISVLTDANADGQYDESKIFGDKLVFPMGLAWREGKLYVADPPDLITLEDTDDDGRADKHSVVLTGFGHTDNGSLHGLTFGPDGWLYMTMGQPDGFRIKRSDGRIIEGKSGALLRCKPDGSDLEVLCRGFENLVEVVFLPTGEIVGTDNWFFLPQQGVRDALVHLVPGGTYPLNVHAKVESGNFSSGELLPAIQVYPAVALSGLMRHSGVRFPREMQGSLFSAQFNTRKIVRHDLVREGSTFRSIDADFLTTNDPDFHPSDVLEDHDGSILVIDTGSWYVHHCPTGRIRKTPAQGGIYRIGYANSASVKTESEVLNVADSAAKRAREMGREKDPELSGELARLLKHEAAHVRLAAAEALSMSGSSNAVAAIADALAEKNDEMLAHSLLYALHQTASAKQLEKMLAHEKPEVRRAALIVLDQAPHHKLRAEDALAAARSNDAMLRSAGIASLTRHPEWSHASIEVFREILQQKVITRDDAATLSDWILHFRKPFPVGDLVENAARDKQKPVSSRALLVALLPGLSNDAVASPALREALRSNEQELVSGALRSIRLGAASQLRPELTDLVNSRRPIETRLEAMRLLVRVNPRISPQDFSLFQDAWNVTNTPAVRLSAAEILSNAELNANQLGLFIEHARNDRLISPLLVLTAAERCKEIKPAAEALVRYLAEAVDAGWTIPEDTLESLMSKLGESRGLEMLARKTKERSETRLAELEKLERLLEGGDPNNGQQLFIGKLTCATCHRVGSHGGLVGPDLTKVGAIRSGRDMIESLAMPGATLAQGYETYRVTMRSGEVFTGMRVRTAADSFVLRDSSGAEQRFEEREILTAEPQQNSLMPEGLLNGLQEQEIRDLLAYLQGLK